MRFNNGKSCETILTMRGNILQMVLDTQNKYKIENTRRGKSKVINILLVELSDKLEARGESPVRQWEERMYGEKDKKLKSQVRLEGKALQIVRSTQEGYEKFGIYKGKSKIINYLLTTLQRERAANEA